MKYQSGSFIVGPYNYLGVLRACHSSQADLLLRLNKAIDRGCFVHTCTFNNNGRAVPYLRFCPRRGKRALYVSRGGGGGGGGGGQSIV